MTGKTILIVEDNAIIALSLKILLTRNGYTVQAIVDSGEDAVTLVSEQCPNLILMDIQLDGQMDGFTTAQNIQAANNITIIYLTGNTQDPRLENATYLSKPVAEWRLLEMIETFIDTNKLP